jgi:hypothetical protein
MNNALVFVIALVIGLPASLLILWLAGNRDGLLGAIGAALRFVGWLVLLPVELVLELRRKVMKT